MHPRRRHRFPFFRFILESVCFINESDFCQLVTTRGTRDNDLRSGIYNALHEEDKKIDVNLEMPQDVYKLYYMLLTNHPVLRGADY